MDTIYSKPNEEFDSTIQTDTSGLVGTIGVQIIDADTGVVINARHTTDIIEAPAGSGVYAARLLAPGAAGTYSVVWDTGSITPDTVGADRLIVNAAGEPVPAPPTGLLLTLSEFKSAIGETGTQDDDAYTWALQAATQAIINFTERDFATPVVTEIRSYEYDGSGWVDIDDASLVTAVELVYPQGSSYPLDATTWTSEPYGSSVISSIRLYDVPFGSREMGFTYNLDTYEPRGPSPIVRVTGTWGWPIVPNDVKQAAIWTAITFKENPGGWISESIDGYSRTIAPTPPTAIPPRAQELLAQYQRIKV